MIARRKELALYKSRSTTIVPFRQGPIQCIRSCPHCTDRKDTVPTQEPEAILALKTFKDLSHRVSFWDLNYRSIQYHEAQIYLLAHAIKNHAPKTIIIAGVTNYKDVKVLEIALDIAQIRDRQMVDVVDYNANYLQLLDGTSTLVFPLHYETCTDGSPHQLMSYESLKNLLRQLFHRVSVDPKFNVNISPVIITKDHGKALLRREGSMCIQIIEPLTIKDYCRNVIISDKTSHLLQHIYHDISHHSVILPTHLVSFLILYLERQQGPTLEDLTYYVDWFRRVSLEYKIFFGFTGDAQTIVEVGLRILGPNVYLSKNGCYQAKDLDRLTAYGQTMTPMIAVYGCIARAILEEFNNIGQYEPQITFPYRVPVKVSSEKVRKTAITFMSELDDDICFKRPCRSVESCVTEALSNMQLQGRFFKLNEPKVDTNRGRFWAGEFSDDEYNSGQVEPVWLVVSEKGKRRDRLNLFINAIG